MAKRKNESQSSMGNDNWSPAPLCDRPLETDFVRGGFAVLESFVNKVELKEIVPLVESILTSSHELACTRPHVRSTEHAVAAVAADVNPLKEVYGIM